MTTAALDRSAATPQPSAAERLEFLRQYRDALLRELDAVNATLRSEASPELRSAPGAAPR